ncbi:hypothetical protein C5B96_08180 [Subtercola sp. Z020]|uniref:hypothetical protein n=1 Tax=Subtercola sp. Z020 TaxID=2080582 RepID=UPI000CE8C075|nr:hypothetical protein [Subtercola sp. Z020]PPF83338.1 hypothetical protein C5B96_08180 [Subtercola sp. Z020]
MLDLHPPVALKARPSARRTVGWVALSLLSLGCLTGLFASQPPAPRISAAQLAERVRVVAMAKSGMSWTPVVDCGEKDLDVFAGRVVHCDVWDVADPQTVYDAEAILGAPDGSTNISMGVYVDAVPKKRR